MNYKINETILSAIADTIRNKTNSTDTMLPGEFPAAINQVYEAGKRAGSNIENSYYDIFWDAYQQNGTRRKYARAFAGEGWTNDMFYPKYNIDGLYSFVDMFRETGLTGDLTELLGDVILDSSKVGEMQNVFTNAKGITKIGTISLLACKTNTVALFQGCEALHTITCLVVNENNTFKSMFTKCTALENLTIQGIIANDMDLSPCPLSKTDIANIITNNLSNTAAGKIITFNQTAVETAFTTEEWNALVATKANWSIGLG